MKTLEARSSFGDFEDCLMELVAASVSHSTWLFRLTRDDGTVGCLCLYYVTHIALVPTFHLKRLRSATAEETDRLRKRLRIGRARDFLDIPVEDNPFALEHGHVIMESERGEFEAWAPMIEWHWNVTPEDEYGGFVATCRASILEVEGRQTEAAAVLTAELKRTAVQGDEHWFWRSLMQDFLAGMSARSKSDGEGDEATS